MARIAVDTRSCQVSELRLEHTVWRSAPTAAPVDGSIQSWSITDPSITIASIYIYIYIYNYIHIYNISIPILSSRLLAWLSDWTTPPDQRPKAHRGEPSARCQWWNLPATQCASSLTEFRTAGFPCDTRGTGTVFWATTVCVSLMQVLRIATVLWTNQQWPISHQGERKPRRAKGPKSKWENLLIESGEIV